MSIKTRIAWKMTIQPPPQLQPGPIAETFKSPPPKVRTVILNSSTTGFSGSGWRFAAPERLAPVNLCRRSVHRRVAGKHFENAHVLDNDQALLLIQRRLL